MTPACNLPEGFSTGAALRIEPTTASIVQALRALFEMSTDDRLTMGSRGRALAESNFDWRSVAARMASVYEWVVGGGPRPDGVEQAL